MTRRPRGQAAVELAIGGTLVVTLLLLGIYTGQAALLTLKVQEAGNFALWDATGRRVHEFNNGSASYAPFNVLPATESSAATLRYSDYDGTGTGIQGISLSHAKGAQLTVTCQAANTLDFQPQNPGGLRHPQVFTDVQQLFQPGKGFVQCQATGQISALNVPTTFLDGASGFFNNGKPAKMLQRPNMQVCSDRWCNGNLGVLLGSWALEGSMGDPHNGEVQLPNPMMWNAHYYQMVKKIFDDNGKGEGTGNPSRVRNFVQAIAGEPAPINEDTFYMSVRGIETMYVEDQDGLEGRMTRNNPPAPQLRRYDTNGAPTELDDYEVWKWQRPAGNCGGCINPAHPAVRENYFLGLPPLVQ
jgi:hypothetical protein